MNPAERASRMADYAREKISGNGPDPAKFQVARGWWRVTKPAGVVLTFFWPYVSERELEKIRPGCRVEAVI